jgi:hypothetical protein
MKAVLVKLSALVLMMLSFSSFAEKITISGSPVVLEQRGDVYYVPSTYSSTTAYNFVTIGGKNRVCYLEKQPNLASVDLMTVNVNVGGTTAVWNCYDATNTEYFEITS